MAKPNWLNLQPSSGSGNGTIANSASPHTGRVARTGVVTVTAAGVATPATYNVTQTPKAEFVSFNNGSEMAVATAGGNITISGKSNSSKLNFEWVIPSGKTQPEVTPDGDEEYAGVDLPSVVIPDTYTAAGTTTRNNTAIEDDPGASEEFDFNISLVFPENPVPVEIDRTLRVTANGSQVAQIVIKQTAAEPYIRVSPTDITIPQTGAAVNVTVTSNTNWQLS